MEDTSELLQQILQGDRSAWTSLQAAHGPATLEGQGHAEIARALSLPEPKQAEQLIRRLNARLRYRFMSESCACAGP